MALCEDLDDDTGDADTDADAEDSTGPTFCLWPCNLPTFYLWQRIQTQWRVGGMGERTGLDYDSVIGYMRKVARIKRRDFEEVFSGIQTMEEETLRVLAEKRPA